jgi:hypothetical protein
MSHNLDAKLKEIENCDRALVGLFEALIMENDNIYNTDFYLLGIFKRTLAHSQTFCVNIRDRNSICAGTILRAQLDTALRANAIFLVKNPNGFSGAVLDGTPINKMRGTDGQMLTDAYLAQKLTEKHSWVKRVYDKMCEYGHFSDQHIVSSFSKKNDDGTFSFQLTPFDSSQPDEAYFEIVECFLETVRITGEIGAGWHQALALWRRNRRRPPTPLRRALTDPAADSFEYKIGVRDGNGD